MQDRFVAFCRRVLRFLGFRSAERFQRLSAEILELTERQRQLADRFETELASLARRQEELDRLLRAHLAMGWDHVALVRRVAILEDQASQLTPLGPGHWADEADLACHDMAL